MAVYGYVRVSSVDQDHAIQAQALRNAGCEIIRCEKVSVTPATVAANWSCSWPFCDVAMSLS